MSKHYRRNKKQHSVTSSTKVSSSDWEQLASNHTEREAYLSFVQEVQRAQSLAEQRSVRMGRPASDLVDMRRAVDILDTHPGLYRYVQAAAKAEHREHLIAATQVPEHLQASGGFKQKGSPTQSNPHASNVLGSAWSGTRNSPLAVPNARNLRNYADSNEWARGAINVRRDQVSRAEIAVEPSDPNAPYDKKVQYQTEMILDQPNEYRQNYAELFGGLTEDILVLDRGVLSKSMTLGSRLPTALYQEDGATIAIYPAWSGNPDEPRYLYTEPGTDRKVPLRNDEAIVMMMNPASYRMGLSIMQVLWNTVMADLKATQVAMRMVDQKPPPHMVQIPGASETQLEDLADKYMTDFAGLRELFFIGGQDTATVFPLVFSAKDNQFLEWQVYLARKICALFRVSPQQLMITFDINKATAGVQQDIYEDTGLIPLLLVIESYVNREFLADFAPRLKDGRSDMAALNLRVMYPQISESARMLHAQESIATASDALAGIPQMTINQALAMRGEEPVPGGDTFYLPSTTAGFLPGPSYDGELGDYVNDPTAASQALGGQDAMGGPDINQDNPGKAPANDDPAQPTSPPGQDGSTDGSTAGSSKGKRASRPAIRRVPVDRRPAGYSWRPGYMATPVVRTKRQKVPDSVAESYALPHDIVRARLDLSTLVQRTFESVDKRGRAYLETLEDEE